MLAVVALAAFAAAGQQESKDEPFPLTVKVGKSVAVCKTGALTCPAGSATCDDTSVATASIDETEGLVFKGVGPGTTLCSAATGGGFGYRRVFRITVTP